MIPHTKLEIQRLRGILVIINMIKLSPSPHVKTAVQIHKSLILSYLKKSQRNNVQRKTLSVKYNPYS